MTSSRARHRISCVPRRVRYKAPFGFDDGKPGIGRNVAQVRAEHELEAAAESNAVHSSDHGYRKLPP